MSKTWKKGLKNLTLAFSLAASPFLISAPVAEANHPESYNPIGLWQAIEHNMIAQVEPCSDSTSALCATVYRTSTESVSDAIEKEKSRKKAGLPPKNHSGETSTYCSIFEKTSAHEIEKDVWESDDISMFIFSVRMKMTVLDNENAKGNADVRLKLFNAGITDIDVTAKKISPEGPEFQACRTLKIAP